MVDNHCLPKKCALIKSRQFLMWDADAGNWPRGNKIIAPCNAEMSMFTGKNMWYLIKGSTWQKRCAFLGGGQDASWSTSAKTRHLMTIFFVASPMYPAVLCSIESFWMRILCRSSGSNPLIIRQEVLLYYLSPFWPKGAKVPWKDNDHASRIILLQRIHGQKIMKSLAAAALIDRSFWRFF